MQLLGAVKWAVIDPANEFSHADQSDALMPPFQVITGSWSPKELR